MNVLLIPLNELDRADLPRTVKESMRQNIIAIATAYSEDDDPQKIEPDAQSFVRLLKFLEHPHRWSWPAPAISVNPEGGFSAIWDEPGVNRWILDFSSNEGIESTHLKTHPDGRIEYTSHTIKAGDEILPPFAIS
jgi:hypothetical protein